MTRQILITGGQGQVAQSLLECEENFPAFQLMGFSSKELDITDEQNVRAKLLSGSFDAVINCAAYTDVDGAESDSARAFEVNEKGAGLVAAICQEAGIPLVHLSSDYVYHSGENKPFKETDETTPKGVYAHSKLAGEQAVRKNHDKHIIVRSSWIYSAYGKNFVKTMLKLGQEKRELKVVIDQIGTPTYAYDLAQTILQMLQQVLVGGKNETLNEIYNYSNGGFASWYYFAKCIFDYAQMPVRVHPVDSDTFPRPAPRPPWSVMSLEKIKKAFGIDIPEWEYSLKRSLPDIVAQIDVET